MRDIDICMLINLNFPPLWVNDSDNDDVVDIELFKSE